MKINIDDGDSVNGYFISVPLNDRESISFDNTYKGHRVLKQVLQDKKEMSHGAKITAEWDTIALNNGKFENVEHIKWLDLDKKDWCNDEIWETVWEKPTDSKLDKELLSFSNYIRANYRNLDAHKVADFQNLLTKEVARFQED
ncbi:MAG: hypothetical protein Q8R17_02955 [bacterium]|nr:hypothetical protein [bacterium]